MAPHTASPAPMVVTRVCNTSIALLKNSIVLTSCCNFWEKKTPSGWDGVKIQRCPAAALILGKEDIPSNTRRIDMYAGQYGHFTISAPLY